MTLKTNPQQFAKLTALLVVAFLSSLQLASVWAEGADTDPYEMVAPNGGELEKLSSGEYRFHLRTPVKITHGELILKGDDGWLYHQAEKAVLEGNVTIYDAERTLFADKAIYFKKERKIILIGKISANDFERNLFADKVTYWRDDERMDAQGSVLIDDLTDNIVISGNHAFYDGKAKIAEFDDSPTLITEQKDGQTIEISANFMRYNSREKKALALGNVIIHEERSRAFCNAATLSREQDRLEMDKKPVILYEDEEMKSEISGDHIAINYSDNRLEDVTVQGAAVVLHYALDQPHVSDDQINYVAGDRILMLFNRKAVEQVIVTGEARSIYFPETTSPQKPERNDVAGERISLDMEKGKVVVVSVTGECAGTYAFPNDEDD